MKKTITFFSTRAAMLLLTTLLLTMTAQTAWAQQFHPLPDPDGEGNVTLDGGEYIVSSNVTISGNITANGPVNLTISSDATLTVGGMGPKQIQMEGGTINVEGGTISGQDCNINVNTFNMNGGSINVSGLIFRSGTIQNATIEAWSVGMTAMTDNITITGSRIVSNGILADGVTFSGSNVTVNGCLTLSGAVVFDASSPAVSINVEKYDNDNGGTLTISNGSLTDGTNIYTGTIANPSVLNGKTLTYYNASSAITVLLNAQGGSGGTTSVTPTADEDMPTITPPTRTGYTFGGYYTETNGGGTKYYDADGTSAHVCELTGTVTLYAKWTANDYTVTLDRQGGSGQESVTATFGSAMPALNPVPSRTDCEFFGYYTETNGGGTKYYNANGTSARAWGIDANTTLYAYWKKYLSNQDITVEIPAQTYNGNELTPVVTVKDGNDVVSDEHYTIFLPDGGCTNAGNYTISIDAKHGNTLYVDGTTATFTINCRAVTLTSATDSKTYDGNALTNDGVTVGGDGFADGEGATYNVTGSQTDAGSSNNTFTYTLNDGTLDANYNITTVEGMLTITKAASSVTAAPTARSLVYDGFEQTLINAGTASGGTMYYSLDNSTWSTGLPTATEAGEYTVYYKVEGDGNHNNTDAASIKAYIDYTITYDLAGGSVASANPTRYNVTTATFTLTNPTRTGYDFAGWTGTGLIYPEKEVTIAQGSAGNRSYTATWETINFEENDITYEWTGSGTNLLVAGYNGNSASLDIPKSVDHNGVSYTVTEIGKEAFENNSTLTSIDISSNSNPITIIGARAFKDCTNLSNIEIPAELQSIGSEAFRGCALTKITIPETVTSIGQRAFADCPSLTSVTLPETETIWGENPFEGCSENLIIYVPEHLVDTYRSLWPDANILAVGTIPYIAADGSTAYRKYGEYTELTGSTSTVTLGSDGETTWYVVNDIVNYGEKSNS